MLAVSGFLTGAKPFRWDSPWSSKAEARATSEPCRAHGLLNRPTVIVEDPYMLSWSLAAQYLALARRFAAETPSLMLEIEATLVWLGGLGGVRVPRRAEVREYLVRHPDMIEVAESLCAAASRRLREDCQVSLEVYHDPEIEDEYLTLYVRQQEYDEGLLTPIEELYQACEQQLIGRSGWLLVTTDFRPPT